jgi:hypothetical protein
MNTTKIDPALLERMHSGRQWTAQPQHKREVVPLDPLAAKLYESVNKLMAHIGAYGEVDSRSPLVGAVMDDLKVIDGGVYSAALAAQEPAQAVEPEPVAWRYKYRSDFGGVHWCYEYVPGKQVIESQALYTHPAPAKPLSDEQIDEIAQVHYVKWRGNQHFARAVIAEFCKLNGIKETS